MQLDPWVDWRGVRYGEPSPYADAGSEFPVRQVVMFLTLAARLFLSYRQNEVSEVFWGSPKTTARAGTIT